MQKSLQAGETYMYKGRPPAIRPPESTPEHRHLILRHSPCTSMSMRDVYLPFYCPVFRDAYMLVLFVTGKPYQATGFFVATSYMNGKAKSIGRPFFRCLLS